jgi:hypothetical protein
MKAVDYVSLLLMFDFTSDTREVTLGGEEGCRAIDRDKASMTRSAPVNNFLATRLLASSTSEEEAPLRLAGKPFAADQGSRMRFNRPARNILSHQASIRSRRRDHD